MLAASPATAGPLDVHRLELDTEHQGPERYHGQLAVTLHTTSAGPFQISGKVLTMLPLRNRREGKVTRISEGLTEWR